MNGYILISFSNDNFEEESILIDYICLFGVLILLLFQVLSGFKSTYQENIFDTYEINPLKMIKMESMISIIICTFIFCITSLYII